MQHAPRSKPEALTIIESQCERPGSSQYHDRGVVLGRCYGRSKLGMLQDVRGGFLRLHFFNVFHGDRPTFMCMVVAEPVPRSASHQDAHRGTRTVSCHLRRLLDRTQAVGGEIQQRHQE